MLTLKQLLPPTAALAVVLCGCERAPRPAARHPYYHHIWKCDLPYERTIPDPRRWALIQFADGPIDGPEVSAYAKGVVAAGLEEAKIDLNADGRAELLLRQSAGGRNWVALVFTPAKGGYRYMGELGGYALRTLPPDRNGRARVMTAWSCGGKIVLIGTFKHTGSRFELTRRESITGGDNAPEANNRRLDKLFGARILQWR